VRTVSLFLVLALIFTCQVRANSDDAVIDRDIQALSKAMESGDVGTIMDMTYSPLMKSMGDETTACVKLLDSFGKMKGRSIKMTRCKLLEPRLHASGDEHDYVFVPVQIEFRNGFHDFEEQSYFLAIRFRGSNSWQYVSGSKDLPSQSDGLFPDLPKSIVLPVPKMAQVD
jgi:hypothetical protein